ncbi:hypothetical protein FDF86_04510 [Clostridium botulinum]|nr:hypothetical protein [Clostridium botulinum]
MGSMKLDKITEIPISDLNKLDIIEITSEQYKKIWYWVSDNWNKLKNRTNELKLPFNEFIIRNIDSNNIANDLTYITIKECFRIITFLEDEHTKETAPMIIWDYYNVNNFEDLRNNFFENKNCDYYLSVTKEFIELCSEEYDKTTLENNLQNLTNDYRLECVQMFFRILVYYQFNQESIIRETRTNTKKVKSKNTKRVGKKPKVKLINQNIIRINTDDIEEPTEEEKREYERHIFGWTVRGHWREYKSGKKIWIKPQIRGDKEQMESKIYEIE